MRTLSEKQAKINLVVYCLGYTLLFPLLASLILQAAPAFSRAWLWPGLEAAIYLVTFAVVVLGSLPVLKAEMPIFLKNRKAVLKEIATDQALMYFLNFVCNLCILLITGSEQSNNQEQVIGLLHSSMLSTVFLTVCFAPLVEELVFRASFFSLFYKKNKALTVFLASCAFGLLHVLSSLFSGDWMDCIYLLSYASMGFCLCRCYIRSETIYGPIFLHMLNNSISVLLLLML